MSKLTGISSWQQYSFALKTNIIVAGYLVVAFTIFAYYPIHYLFFASPDDGWMLLKNELVHPDKFTLHYLYEVFMAPNDIQYSPVNTLYYYLIYQINGYDPYYYHIFSFGFHLVNILLVYKLSKQLLISFSINNAGLVAYIACFIWAIHPLNVESVVWISASKVVLFSFFSLLSFFFFVRGYLKDSRYYLLLSLIYFVLSCLCKEQSIVTPIMFLSFIVFYNLKHKKHKIGTGKIISCVVVSFIISIAVGIVSMKLNGSESGYITPIVKYSFLERIILFFYCLSFYLTNLLIPVNLHFHYSYPFPKGEQIPMTLYIYPLVFIAFGYFLYILIKHSSNKFFYLFCISLFLIQIGLVLQVIPMTRPAIMADRYMYIPLFPLLLILFDIGVNYLPKQLIKNKIKNLLVISFLLLYIVALTIYSNRLAHKWFNLNLIEYAKK